jgi:hypothetical protein
MHVSIIKPCEDLYYLSNLSASVTLGKSLQVFEFLFDL